MLGAAMTIFKSRRQITVISSRKTDKIIIIIIIIIIIMQLITSLTVQGSFTFW